MPRKVEHIGSEKAESERSITFHTEVLSLALRDRVRQSETVELASITIGDMEIELVHRAGAPTARLGGVVNHLAFTVDDIDSVLAHLRKHRVSLITE